MENQGEPISVMLSRQDLIDRSSITSYLLLEVALGFLDQCLTCVS